MNRQEQIELLKKEISERQKMLRELRNTSTKCGRVEYENCGSYGNYFIKTYYSDYSMYAKERRMRIATVKDKDKIAYIDELIKDLTDLKNRLTPHAYC